jgi:hypothetical protein
LLFFLNWQLFCSKKWDCQIIPAVSRIKKTIGVVFWVVLTWEEHQQSAWDRVFDAFDDR